MEEKQLTIFDKEEVFKTQVQPLIDELMIVCNRHEIPLFVGSCYKNDYDGTKYKLELISPTANNIYLADNKFVDWVNVYNGFTTVLKPRNFEINVGEYY